MSGDASRERAARIATADKIIAVKREVASDVNRDFFRRHPDWEQRYGAGGVQRGFEDACHHLDYLAAAVETGSVQLFENYARWTGRVLQSRGIAPHFVIENLEQIESALTPRVPPDELTSVHLYVRAATSALLHPAASAELEPAGDESRQLFRRALLLGKRNAAS